MLKVTQLTSVVSEKTFYNETTAETNPGHVVVKVSNGQKTTTYIYGTDSAIQKVGGTTSTYTIQITTTLAGEYTVQWVGSTGLKASSVDTFTVEALPL